MRPRREYSVAVIIGLVAMGLAMVGAGAALFLIPPPGYAPPPTPTPTVAATPSPASPGPSLVESPSAEPSSEPSIGPTEEPTAAPTVEPTPLPTPDETPIPGDQFSQRRDDLPACDDMDNCGVHIAKPGDWLSRLANYYGITLNTITEANPEIDDPNLIAVGQEIRIPR